MKNDTNPWLKIPADEYEGHMSHCNVRQAQFLSGYFTEVLKKYNPGTILFPGASTGNGFEHIEWDRIEKITAIDINPEYLDLLRKSYTSPKIETVCTDLAEAALPEKSFGLAHCALVFEYVDYVKTLKKISGWLKEEGVLSVVLQLPSDKGAVSESPYISVNILGPVIKLTDPGDFEKEASQNGLQKLNSSVVTLESGKQFYTGEFRKV